MKVLIACESSGRVREAFRAKGHEAWSCDMKPAEDRSCYHVQGDALSILDWGWDLMVGHPPCTYLCNSGVRWLYEGGKKSNPIRWDEQRVSDLHDAIDFFKALRAAPVEKIALENPIMHGAASGAIGKASQFVQPWFFGDPAFKSTGLWLKNLPLLKPTNKLTPPKPRTEEHKEWSVIHRASPGPNRGEERSRTFPGLANAMAEQWG